MIIPKSPIISKVSSQSTITKLASSVQKPIQTQGLGKTEVLHKNIPAPKKRGFIGVVTAFIAGIGTKIDKKLKDSAIAKIDKKFDALQENIPQVRKTFKEVFLRDDITPKETSEMLERYRSIEKLRVTGEKDDYIKALFKEAKKNFGFENVNIPLRIENIIGNNEKCNGYTKDMMQYGICVKRNPHKMSHMNIIHHELRHEKQNYIAANYDKEAYIQSAIKSIYNKAKSNKNDFLYPKVKEKTFEEYYQDMQDIAKNDIFKIEQVYGKLDRTNVREKDIPFAQKCLQAKRTRVNGEIDYKSYKKNFLEKDAFCVGETMDKLLG